MGSRSVLVVLGVILGCCLLLACCGTLMAIGYFYFQKPAIVTQAPVPVPPATLTPAVPATPTSQVSCPAAMQVVLSAGQGEGTEPGIGLGGAASSSVDDPETTTLVTYDVLGDTLGAPDYESVEPSLQAAQDNLELQRSAWELFRALIPSGGRSMVTEYVIFTDGPGNILAAVQQSSEDAKMWGIELDSADLSDRSALIFTLVHEFAHLLSLNSSQVPPDMQIFDHPDDDDLYDSRAAACSTYFPGEGCSLPNSYINAFYNNFWPNLIDEWQAIDDLSYGDDTEQYYDELYGFYQAHRDEFVDDYAATDPSEDLAESFAFFIFSSKPSGDSIRDDKIRFFYNYPELVKMRTEILANLCKVHP